MGVPWWNRLGVKLSAVVSLLSLAAVASFAVASFREHRLHLEDEVIHGAARFSDTIKSSTHHEMLEDRRAEAYRIMETIGRQEGIERVRIFNKEGRITFSTVRAEIGTSVDKRAESCYACHAADRPMVRLAVPSRARIYEARDGHRVLGMVTPIYNEPSCSRAACHAHPATQRVLGVVDIGVSLAAIDSAVTRLAERTVLLAALAVVVLAGMVLLISHRYVVRPVAELVEGTQSIAKLDLDHHIDVRSTSGELSLLADSFNHMTDSLRRSREQVEHLMEHLERLVEERTRALREAQGQLVQAEKLASLGKLAASIAHEINNPLLGILTYAKLLGRTVAEGEIDEAGRASCARGLGLIERETQRCSAIVRNLLDFSRQRPLTLGAVDVNAAVEEALSLLGNQIALQEIRLDKRLGEVPTVQADFGQVRQALVNVMLNACEAMGKGGTLGVATRAAGGGDAVEIEIADTGCGIPEELRTRILDPFFTTKEKGTGLGLSVVYGIVERHGGSIDVRSRVGEGTSMTLRLRSAPAAAAGAGG